MPAQLVAITEGPNILLDKPILLIGRHQECDIQIPSRKISRRHCCIAQVDDHLVVRDLCSTNGIRINGVRVNEGLLRSGDEITIGNFRYQVNWSTHPGGQLVPPPFAAPAKPKAAPRMGLPVDQNILESCEEPIPLAEPDQENNADLPPVLPTNATAPPALHKDEAPSQLIPDNLKLAPISDPQVPPQ